MVEHRDDCPLCGHGWNSPATALHDLVAQAQGAADRMDAAAQDMADAESDGRSTPDLTAQLDEQYTNAAAELRAVWSSLAPRLTLPAALRDRIVNAWRHGDDDVKQSVLHDLVDQLDLVGVDGGVDGD